MEIKKHLFDKVKRCISWIELYICDFEISIFSDGDVKIFYHGEETPGLIINRKQIKEINKISENIKKYI